MMAGTFPVGGAEGGPSRELHRRPPEHPFSLLLRLLSGGLPGGRAERFGSELIFSLQDTVTAGSESDMQTEYGRRALLIMPWTLNLRGGAGSERCT